MFKEKRGSFIQQAIADGQSSPSHFDWKLEAVKPKSISFKISARGKGKNEQQQHSPQRSDEPGPGQYETGSKFKKMFDRSISFSFYKKKGGGLAGASNLIVLTLNSLYNPCCRFPEQD